MTPSSIGSGCCGSTPAVGASQTTSVTVATSTPVTMGGGAPTSMTTMSPTENGTGPAIRDSNKAAQWLEYIKRSTMARFADINSAMVAGYKRNPASGNDAVQHYLSDGVFKLSDATDLANPATLMYRSEADGRQTLVGVMLSAAPDTPLPDFGAGAWHRHPSDDRINMHIWFDKTVQQGAFENSTATI